MGALTLGLIAALCWGVHDTLVRYISQQVGVFPSLFPVLVTGCIMSAGLALALDTTGITAQARGLAVLSGIVFGITGLSFYKALSIGPVRLVAPVVASFPILSVGWAVTNGQGVSLWQWAAVLIIVGGCGVVAVTSEDADSTGRSRTSAVLWSILAAIGFATSFALGQQSMAAGTEMMAIATARVGAVAVVGGLALILRQSVIPARSALPILIVMGVLDAIAIGAIMLAGSFAFPYFASVAASTFGVFTIILAAVFLKEAVTGVQWLGIVVVFSAIGYLAI
ncbi:DMT family transporter [Poseidonocella sedimentorum]|uniref:EamA-like transporter family protein n=1 Tax=Poseidonocella sedimentorum TaxID=871652 RepID=A0A1I6DKI6_9RHOB|nr:DMT family transporter [Poseidonocella sedimentorum]SFR05901.1 EamA-like transporter family protein [Poseidonocella sedimentorum]